MGVKIFVSDSNGDRFELETIYFVIEFCELWAIAMLLQNHYMAFLLQPGR